MFSPSTASATAAMLRLSKCEETLSAPSAATDNTSMNGKGDDNPTKSNSVSQSTLSQSSSTSSTDGTPNLSGPKGVSDDREERGMIRHRKELDDKIPANSDNSTVGQENQKQPYRSSPTCQSQPKSRSWLGGTNMEDAPEDEEDAVRRLQESGAFREVVGSQSVLSQELLLERERDLSHSQHGHLTAVTMSQMERAGQDADSPSSKYYAHKEDDGDEPPVSSQPFLSQTTLHLYESANFGQLLNAVDMVEDHRAKKFESSEDESTDEDVETEEVLSRGLHGWIRIESAQKTRRKRKALTLATNGAVAVEQSSNLSDDQSQRRVTKRRVTVSAKKPAPKVSSDSIAAIAAKAAVLPESVQKAIGAPAPSIGPLDKLTPSVRRNHAQQAAELASMALTDATVSKRLLLGMVLHNATKERPQKGAKLRRGHVLTEGFPFALYPPLEKILKENMGQYYQNSIENCQSVAQSNFTGSLVRAVRKEVNSRGWILPSSYTDQVLRTRIRCYYKTHIQNAKKVSKRGS